LAFVGALIDAYHLYAGRSAVQYLIIMHFCTTTLYVQLALDEARRSRETDQLVAEAAATHCRQRDGADLLPYSEGETNEDYGDSETALDTAPEIGLVDREPPPRPCLNGNSARRRTSTAGTRTRARDRSDGVAEIDEGGARGVVQERMITEFSGPFQQGYPGALMLERERERERAL